VRKVLFFLVAAIFIATSAHAKNELELSFSGGYHIWSQSGHTFIHSEKEDKEFNGPCYQAEATYWWGNTGLYFYGGKDHPTKVEIFDGRYYEADVTYFGSGLKIRKDFKDWLTGYVGTGVNYTILENDYRRSDGSAWARSETLPNVGPDVLMGLQFKHDSGFFTTLHARYSCNREMSKTFNQTTFDAGGLRMFLGVGYTF